MRGVSITQVTCKILEICSGVQQCYLVASYYNCLSNPGLFTVFRCEFSIPFVGEHSLRDRLQAQTSPTVWVPHYESKRHVAVVNSRELSSL